MKRNTQKELVEFLEKNPCKTENEILSELWNFNRKRDWGSNKNYAELIRRALRKGTIKRLRMAFKEEANQRMLFRYFVNKDYKIM